MGILVNHFSGAFAVSSRECTPLKLNMNTQKGRDIFRKEIKYPRPSMGGVYLCQFCGVFFSRYPKLPRVA